MPTPLAVTFTLEVEADSTHGAYTRSIPFGGKLLTSTTISGRVMSAATGLPVADAMVTYEGAGSGNVKTDAEGVYVFPVVDGEYFVAASADGVGASGLQMVAVPPEQEVDFILGNSTNVPPTIHFSPEEALVDIGRSTRIWMRADDPDGAITNVSLRGAGLVVPATLTNRFSITWYVVTFTASTEAVHTLYPVAFDDQGAVTRSSASVVIRAVDIRDPDVPGDTVNGLDYAYYEGDWGALPDFDALTPVATGVVDRFTIDDIRERDDAFALVFTGYIDLFFTGVHTFYLTSDEGSRLFVNGELVVDNDGLHDRREKIGTFLYSRASIRSASNTLIRTGRSFLMYASPNRVVPSEGNQFEVRAQVPGSNGAVDLIRVHYVAVEEGFYGEIRHGIRMEARKTTSSTTDYAGRWMGEKRNR